MKHPEKARQPPLTVFVACSSVRPHAINFSFVMLIPGPLEEGAGNAPANGLFEAVAGVLFSSLKVNFQPPVHCCKCVANAPQCVSALWECRILNLLKYQGLSAHSEGAEAPKY